MPIHSLNGHPINNHPLNVPHHHGPPHNSMNNPPGLSPHHSKHHSINHGHAIPLNFQRPHFKINNYDSYKSYENDKTTLKDKLDNKNFKYRDKLMDDRRDRIDKQTKIDKESNFPKLPPNELVNQLVDFDSSYLLPKHDNPALHSVMEDRYRRLLFGQFYESISPTYSYESLVDLANDTKKKPIKTQKHTKTTKLSKHKKKSKKKDLENRQDVAFQMPNGGEAHLIKMGIIK